MSQSLHEVRAFVRSRRRRPVSLADRYATVFMLAMAVAVFGNPVTTAVTSLGRVAPERMGPGVALVMLALAGFLAAGRAAGPVVLPAADASWLLLSPIGRRGLLGRPVRILAVITLAVGALLGLAFLAALGAPDQLTWRLLAAVVLGMSASAAGMALAVLGQGSPTWQTWSAVALVTLVVVALVVASGALRGPLAAVAAAPVQAVAAAAAGALMTAALLVRRAWRSLDRIPASTLMGAAARARHLTTAAVQLDPGALTWAAEDNHWRARRLRSKGWPSLPAPLALAWQDWRRVARRPGRLALTAGTTFLPALLAQATGAASAVLVLAGALAVAASAVSGARRDADNPALARLAAVGPRRALLARAVLPALLSGAWATAALGWLIASGLMAGPWWALGPLIAPALAAAALRMARRPPVDHALPLLDTPMGTIPAGPVIWAATGPDLALLGCLPAFAALTGGFTDPAGHLIAQAAAGLATLAIYTYRQKR
jgi:hypothetical protein